ncbi:MAG: peptidase domain-containing ABC transporter [Planctomycetes bacterium]|nr:peptidase domain-containing ABC transporter [Planctomycetota bacterium]
MRKRFPFHPQLDAMDCGPAALRMICAHYGRDISQERLRELCQIGKGGVNLLGIGEAAEQVGMRALAVKLSFRRLREEAPLPCIAHWQNDHFVVVYEITRKKVRIADPAYGLIDCSHAEFLRASAPPDSAFNEDSQGIYMLLEPTPALHETGEEPLDEQQGARKGLTFFATYLKPHKRLLIQVLLGMTVGLVLELIFPFLAQAVVDQGIGNRDLPFIYILLVAQLMMSVSQTSADMIRSWLLLHIGSRVSIAMIRDFLGKLLRLPLPFFESRTAGDIMQRIGDHRRVKSFLMSSSLDVAFSLLTFGVFALVLALYSWVILAVFVVFTAASVAWLLLFLKQRRDLDYKRFALEAQERDMLFEIVHAMSEVKIQGVQRSKGRDWEDLAVRTYRLEARSLALRQVQRVGVFLASNLRNICISFLAARAVIVGDMTLGMLLATQYIVGQLNSPISRLIDFAYSLQDARLSLERMHEIYRHRDEETLPAASDDRIVVGVPIHIREVGFRYPGAGQEDVLRGIDLEIPHGKVTAIVGASGSGKTTLLKLLLALYRPTAGDIRVGDVSLTNLDGRAWRSHCGVVMQDGHVFSASIARNVVPGHEPIDPERLAAALKTASLDDYVRGLPSGVNTVVGAAGQGLSGGQKQRLLLARAVYRQPDYLFLDEATSALDASNESAVLANLRRFARGRTVVVIAHRLSTVRHADQIVVLSKGRIVEAGDHQELVAAQGPYYRLVRDQLDLEGGWSNV